MSKCALSVTPRPSNRDFDHVSVRNILQILDLEVISGDFIIRIFGYKLCCL